MFANQLINEAEVLNTWSPIIESATGVTDKNKLQWMSRYCHFHNLAEQTGMVNESIYNTVHLNPSMNLQAMGDVTLPGQPGTLNQFANQQTGSGDRPFSLLPLAMQVAAQTIGLDLVPVIPMQGPLGVLTYLDYVYGGGREAAIGGLNGKAAPLIVKVLLTNSASGSGNGDGTVKPEDIAPYKAGDKITLGEDYLLTYVGKSRLDGYQIFRVQANDGNGNYVQGSENASKALYEYIYKGATVDGHLCESNLELVKALEDHIPGFSGAAFAMNDQGRGASEHDYQGNNISMEGNLDHNGNAFAIDIDDLDPYERGYGESTPDNIMGLSLFNKSVSAKTYQVAAAVTREQIQDLKQFGIDAVAQIESVLTNELTQNINKLILNRLFRLGTTNVRNLYRVNGIHFNTKFVNALGGNETTFIGNETTFIGKDNTNKPVILPTAQVVVNGGGETQGTLQRRLLTKVLACSNMIAQRGRRGPATFAVCSGKISTALQDCAGFVAYPMMNTINQNGGSLYPVGTIAGVTIYTDPNMDWTDDRILIGRKGNGQEPGLVFMPYLMAESVETIAEGTMAPKLAVKSRFGLVEAGFHPETMYMVIKVECGDGVSLI